MITRYRGEKHNTYFDDAMAWANSTVFREFPKDATFWVAGGAPLAYFQREVPADYDIWFPSRDDNDLTFRAMTANGGKLLANTDSRCIIQMLDGRIYDLIRSKYFDSGEEV